MTLCPLWAAGSHPQRESRASGRGCPCLSARGVASRGGRSGLGVPAHGRGNERAAGPAGAPRGGNWPGSQAPARSAEQVRPAPLPPHARKLRGLGDLRISALRRSRLRPGPSKSSLTRFEADLRLCLCRRRGKSPMMLPVQHNLGLLRAEWMHPFEHSTHAPDSASASARSGR